MSIFSQSFIVLEVIDQTTAVPYTPPSKSRRVSVKNMSDANPLTVTITPFEGSAVSITLAALASYTGAFRNIESFNVSGTAPAWQAEFSE